MKSSSPQLTGFHHDTGAHWCLLCLFVQYNHFYWDSFWYNSYYCKYKSVSLPSCEHSAVPAYLVTSSSCNTTNIWTCWMVIPGSWKCLHISIIDIGFDNNIFYNHSSASKGDTSPKPRIIIFVVNLYRYNYPGTAQVSWIYWLPRQRRLVQWGIIQVHSTDMFYSNMYMAFLSLTLCYSMNEMTSTEQLAICVTPDPTKCTYLSLL